ncbi:hypothetical protein K504DRAFT_448860 [Pleomassaria siparia CBS 279.74]|uniref:Uncharacterized protein n=1 Tax=Pleomassaria siparia CBS 279.74 TaxID=1314801 RepID=A0A6G1JXF2_9PLEO|nr:hypothetical protein K504DRAFT_448860 [Pleomassaria siparia CBS 279.74]
MRSSHGSIDLTFNIWTLKITYPLQFYWDIPQLKKRLKERECNFEAFKGAQFVNNKGFAYVPENKGASARYTVKGRVIIDTVSFDLYKNKFTVENLKCPTESENSVPSEPDSEDLTRTCRTPAIEGFLLWRRPPVHSDVRTASLRREPNLGYSSRVQKQWLRFDIDRPRGTNWNQSAFKSLAAPPGQKDLILALADSQAKQRGYFEDFIQGKGKGIIVLLCAPTCVGKTLNSKSVAEAIIIHVILIGATDGIGMLGIMFFTTNRADNIDVAFKSRIRLTLRYNELDKVSRRQIWSTFVARCHAMRDSSIGKFTDAELDRLAEVQLRVRQIKNVLKTAQLLAGVLCRMSVSGSDIWK